MKTFDSYEVVKKLLGPINPIGESSVDRERLENLDQTAKLIHKLVREVEYIANDHNNGEASLIAASKKAKACMEELNGDKISELEDENAHLKLKKGDPSDIFISRINELEEAMQEFVDRVDKKEVRSKYTYSKFKDLLEGR